VLLLAALSGIACKETGPAGLEARIVPPDLGGKNCDAPPNEWGLRDAGPAPRTGDGPDQIANLFGVWGENPQAIFAVGSHGKVIFYDGKEWKSQPTPTQQDLTAVWGTTAKDVWAVGFGGTVIHFDGSTWQDRSPPVDVFIDEIKDGGLPKGDAAVASRRILWGVWASKAGTGTDSLFVVGERGLILNWKPNTWTRLPTCSPAPCSTVEDHLNGVWGTGPNKAYIVGDFGTILVGPPFAKATTGVAKSLHHVWGHGDSDVYAVGLTGTILHFNGSAWTEVPGAPKQFLRGIWGPGNNRSLYYIVGWDGTILQLNTGATPPFAGFNCVTTKRLEAIYGFVVPGQAPDGGVVGDGGIPLVPAAWIVGATGTVITGP
jgi:hypothetical protein